MPCNASILYKRERRALKLSPEMAKAAVEGGLWVSIWRRVMTNSQEMLGGGSRIVEKPDAIELQVQAKSKE
jgi:hypothetical protein